METGTKTIASIKAEDKETSVAALLMVMVLVNFLTSFVIWRGKTFTYYVLSLTTNKAC